MSTEEEPNLSNKRDLTAWAVLILGGLCTLWIWSSVKNSTVEEAHRRFDFRAEQITTSVAGRMIAYEQILLGGAALFKSSPTPVSREMWRTYVESLKIDENYPGVQGVGFSLQISSEEKNDHVRHIREEGFPDYTIRPEGVRDVYTSIIYLEPFTGRNLRAFGYDMFSEEVRRTAMTRARDSDKPSISGKVVLVQETDQNRQSGFLIYVPVYKKGMPSRTPEERQSALLGYAYSPFRVQDFLQGVLHSQPTDIDFEIYEGEGLDEKSLIYDSDGVWGWEPKSLNAQKTSQFKTEKSIDFNDQKWTLRFRSLSAFEATVDRQKSHIVLAFGAIFSLMCFVITHGAYTTSQRARRLADEMTSALRVSENRLEGILDNSPSVIYMNLKTAVSNQIPPK